MTVFADRSASLVTGWTADTQNTTRRDWRWAKTKNEAVNWPTNSNKTGTRKPNNINTQFLKASGRDVIAENEYLNEIRSEIEFGNDLDPDDLEFQPIKWNQVRVETLIGFNGTAWRVEVPPSHGDFKVNQYGISFYIVELELTLVSGFRAVMIEMSFVGPDDKSDLTFTTEVMITPEKRPFPQCQGHQCYGYLI